MEQQDGHLRFYSATEVAKHNVENDCWVTYFGLILDLTKLLADNREAAGSDITHWFDKETKQYVDPNTGIQRPYTPHGRYVHIPPPLPTASYATNVGTAWWNDEQYVVGRLSKKTRVIRVVNTLTGQEDEVEVCCEDTLSDIRRAYLARNKHAESYTWKRLGRPLNMHKTLEENGVPDDSDELDSSYVPALHLYFNDDLTVA